MSRREWSLGFRGTDWRVVRIDAIEASNILSDLDNDYDVIWAVIIPTDPASGAYIGPGRRPRGHCGAESIAAVFKSRRDAQQYADALNK